MIKQPAKTNYFFKGGYVELWNVIKGSFEKCRDDIVDAKDKLSDEWDEFKSSFSDFIDTMAELWKFEFGNFGYMFPVFWHLFKLIFYVFNLIFVAIFTSIIVSVFSLIHVVLLIPFFLPIYLMFTIVKFFDAAFRMFKRISNVCPSCQRKYPLATYECTNPKCRAKHTLLIPSKYGIFKRVCKCGTKIPTTFFNGRGKLVSYCPHCNHRYSKGANDNEHANVLIPVIGGRSSGKSCFITMAMNGLENGVAAQNGLEYSYVNSGYDDYTTNISNINSHTRLNSTHDKRLRFYQFYLTPPKIKIKNLISLCDIAGEIFDQTESDKMSDQIGYKFADAFLVIIDPLAMRDYKNELLKNKTKINGYNGSNLPIDELISYLTKTLTNMFKMDNAKANKAMAQTNLCLVFTKSDIPGLDEKIGDAAVADYLSKNPGKTELEARNVVCEKFLYDYNEANFVNQIRTKFNDYQFFTVSALGHNEDGTAFKSHNVEDPILWIVDKAAQNINLKDKWGRKL